jgi:ABC-2 type transport system ATP-binding protein
LSRSSTALNTSIPLSDRPSDSDRPAAAIETRSLRRTFKGGIEAVRDIDLTVSAGEVFGFLGPNGAGKTTTVRMLCTLLPPTAGSARIAGLDVLKDSAEVRRRIGVALQEIGLDPAQTGRELLELQCGLYGITGRRGRARTEELLELVGLTEAADRRTKTYSGGMKRRLDLASALVHSPTVLFLDEPTTGLDPASRLTIWDEVRRINASGTTVFLTTQYLEEADKLCDRLAIIDAGRIVIEGTPEQLKAEMGHDVVSVSLDGADLAATEAILAGLPGLERVVAEPDALALYVEDGASSIAEIVRRLDSDGIRVGAIAVARPSLDDVFLRATGRRLEGEETASPEEVASS